MTEAAYYDKLDHDRVSCRLCPHNCGIEEGQSGFCNVRVNRDGILYADSYGTISSYGLDPIEKKPLYRFQPGSVILSIGSFGCNFRCAFCQNHSISMAPLPVQNIEYLTPKQVTILAQQLVPQGNVGVAYTYNEPLIGYEFIKDCAASIREIGLKNVLVTNGYLQPEPFQALLPCIDALNIDLKGFTNAFYRQVKGELHAVKRNIAIAAEYAHVEITTLVIPGENDDESEMDALARFIAGINPDIPLHLSRFFPKHKMTDLPPTPKETIFRLKAVAEQHLRYVYPGNMR